MTSETAAATPSRISRIVRFLFLAIFALGCEVALVAQITTGTILGTVRDQSGAVLPGASVTVTHVETGIARNVATGTKGEYRVPALPVGEYAVQAGMAGFQTGVRRGITLSVGQEAVVDFTLGVGNVTEQVTVSGEAAALETTTATVSGLVDPRQMREIPLNARSLIDLVPLQTGAVFAESGNPSATNGFGKKLSIVGTRYESNSFLLDGAIMNDAAGSAGSAAGGLIAGVETVREFRVITNAYDAEYGHHTGGVISAVTKSGTNDFHGSLFEFLRNSDLDARNFFDKTPYAAPFKRNQFGGSFGGPVRKDKSFFFGSYEGLRQRRGFAQSFIVPGLSARDGTFRGRTIGVDATIKPFLDAYPAPNSPGKLDLPDGSGQFDTSFSEPTTYNYWMARGDHRFSEHDSLFGRVTSDSAEVFTPGQNGFNTGAQAKTISHFVTAEETHIFSPALLSRSLISFNRTNLVLFDRFLPGFTSPKFNFSDSPDVPGIIVLPTPFAQWGGSNTNPKRDIQNVYQFRQDFNFSRGRHAMKFGGQGERLQFNERSDFYPGGQFDFAGLDTFMTRTVSVAHFIRPGSDDIRGWRESIIGLYFHDDFSVRPGLTLNLGLRYEFITVPTEANGKIGQIRDLSPARFYTVLPCLKVPCSPSQNDTGEPYFLNPSLKNFAPRIGLAWTPFKSQKTSLRAGFGVFHDQIQPKNYITAGVRMAPFFSISELFAQNIAVDFPNAFVSQRNALLANVGSLPQADGFTFRPQQPVVMKWSLDIQQQIAPATTFDVGYSGTRGVHLTRGNLNLNATPACPTAAVPSCPVTNGRTFVLITQPVFNPAWGRMRWVLSNGTSSYHALRVGLTKRFSRRFQFQSSYSFSKSTDDSSSWKGSTDWGSADISGYLGSKIHALSSFDVRNSFYTNFLYDLPGAGLHGAAGKLIGGWSISSVLRFNSGNPLNLSADQPRLGSRQMIFVDGPTVDLVAGGKANSIRSQNPNHYVDVSQFAYPGLCNSTTGLCPTGNLGRNVLISPGVANVDLSLNKEFQIPRSREGTKLQFRTEAFNLFNRANFGLPSLKLFDRTGTPVSTAGQITTTRHDARQIQFALKFAF